MKKVLKQKKLKILSQKKLDKLDKIFLKLGWEFYLPPSKESKYHPFFILNDEDVETMIKQLAAEKFIYSISKVGVKTYIKIKG